MKTIIIETFSALAIAYIVAFLYVMGSVMSGYVGHDMLTDHFRWILQIFFTN
jgi:hypothetical protein